VSVYTVAPHLREYEFTLMPAEDAGDLNWRDAALCAQADPETFFPEKGGSTRPAKQVCARCPVKAECLEYALATDQGFGVWGGMSERERRRLTGRRSANTATGRRKAAA